MRKRKNPAAVATASGASGFDLAGRQIGHLTTPEPKRLQGQRLAAPIRAELVADNTCIAAGLSVSSITPVLNLCRALLRAGHDPSTPMQVFRGEVLALKVRSIGEAAVLEINGKGTAFIKRRKAVGTSAPMRLRRAP
jgi:hypothetical protein